MTNFADTFGGSTVHPSDVGLRVVSLSASIITVWPPFATSGNELARIMKISASAGLLTVTLPDATLASTGQDVLFDNAGSNTFTVLDSAGNSIATLTAGQVKYLYLSDNSTAAGTWRVTLFGVGSSTLDASQLAGYGLKAITNTLNLAPVLTPISASTVVTSADRSKVFVWSGGSGTLTLPTTAGSTSDFYIEVRNQGSGSLVITPVGGSLVDGSATISLSVNESCLVHMGATDWYTVGRGRNTAFNFTLLTKSVTGGSVTLSLTEASNVVQSYIGILTANQTVNFPAAVQVYYASNNTTGAYDLTFRCVTTGSALVTVPQGLSVILFCDGANVIAISTSASSIAASANSLRSNSTYVDVSASAPPSAGQMLVATGPSAATWQSISGGDATRNLGYLNIPQNSKSADYTCVLGDAGKHIFHPTADVTGRTFTIPANASVAYPVGTTLTFINQHGAGVISIAITSDTMYFAVSGTTGTRSLAASGIATAVKVTATEWLISGTGIS